MYLLLAAAPCCFAASCARSGDTNVSTYCINVVDVGWHASVLINGEPAYGGKSYLVLSAALDS
jgi:hypothetical protein